VFSPLNALLHVAACVQEGAGSAWLGAIQQKKAKATVIFEEGPEGSSVMHLSP